MCGPSLMPWMTCRTPWSFSRSTPPHCLILCKYLERERERERECNVRAKENRENNRKRDRETEANRQTESNVRAKENRERMTKRDRERKKEDKELDKNLKVTETKICEICEINIYNID